jgi:hypothetical protein
MPSGLTVCSSSSVQLLALSRGNANSTSMPTAKEQKASDPPMTINDASVRLACDARFAAFRICASVHLSVIPALAQPTIRPGIPQPPKFMQLKVCRMSAAPVAENKGGRLRLIYSFRDVLSRKKWGDSDTSR